MKITQMDFNNYKFRCSSLGRLMTPTRKKTDTLSETAKDLLLEVYVEEVFGRKYQEYSKYMDKGNWVEDESLTLVSKVHNKLYVKNREQLNNSFIKGTPDVITNDYVMDIKSSWNLMTFLKADGSNKNYYWQLMGYMYLTGKTNSKLVYTLSNTPEFMIVQEKSRRNYQYGLQDGSEEQAKMDDQVDKEMTFDDIDINLRVKEFEFKYDPTTIKELQDKIIVARDYLNKFRI